MKRRGRGLKRLQEIHVEFQQLKPPQIADLMIAELAESAREYLLLGHTDYEPEDAMAVAVAFNQTVEAVRLLAEQNSVSLDTLSRLGDRFEAQQLGVEK